MSGPNPKGTPPVIQLGTDLKDNVDAAVKALATDADVFHRGGSLVRIVRAAAPTGDGARRPEGAPVIKPVAVATLRERLAMVADWERFDARRNAYKPCLPSDAVVQAVAARGEWPEVRPLVGVAEAPLLRADGTILQTPGYDVASGHFYMPSAAFPPVPDMPTLADAMRARDALLEVVIDFPFASEPHRAAWLALLLTLFARASIDGCVPLGVIDATTRGTGKGKLADATAIIFLGREAAKIPQPEDDKECRKFITALVDEGEVFAVFDNIARPIAFPSLDAALTATVWKDRILSTNRTICAPMLIVFVTTENNTELGGDTARRTLHQRLESPLENPEDREGFRHADLLGWVRSQRPRLAVAALTILRAYVCAGRPDMGCKSWGSFEAWSRIIAGAVTWVGMPDPQSTRVELAQTSDAQKVALAALMAGWARLDVSGAGLTARTVVDVLYPKRREAEAPDGYDDLREAIETLCSCPPGKQPSGRRLGDALRSARRRVIGSMMIDSAPAGGGVQRWRVIATATAKSKSGSGGTEGSFLHASRRDPVDLKGDGDETTPLTNLTNPSEVDTEEFDRAEREAIKGEGTLLQ